MNSRHVVEVLTTGGQGDVSPAPQKVFVSSDAHPFDQAGQILSMLNSAKGSGYRPHLSFRVENLVLTYSIIQTSFSLANVAFLSITIALYALAASISVRNLRLTVRTLLTVNCAE